MAIEIKSLNQLLGDMIRKIMAETPLNDISAGSALLSLLEAAASNDYENNVAILNVLELLNIDVVRNNDLDARAGDYGLKRNPAVRASGLVTILNNNITKRSTGLYVIKPAPIAGQTTVYVNNTENWAPTGTLYIGRGTESFEGPINYTALTVFPTYTAITLASALQKDHLISDIVIDSQNQPDRVVAAGTIVKIPANNQNPEILYATLRDAVIPAGEDSVQNVEVLAQVAGSIGNAPINTITQFDVAPFIGAGVTNISAFSNGKDIETDTELRNRIKSYAITLARGTAPSILESVIGVSDPDDTKQVASAVLTEPVKIGDPSILYIDDGSGFEPSYAGQSVDILINDANGTEEFMQLANYPLPRPQVVNIAEGPFIVTDGSFLRIEVDGKEETIFFTSADFLNPFAAKVQEIVIAINRQSESFKARFTNDSINILIYPVAHDAETIRVSPIRATDDSALYLNNLLKFPTNEFSYIALYQNSTRLREKEKSAEVETTSYASWNITAPGSIIIAVDGTPTQERLFTLSDFPGASSFTSLTLNDWITAFNLKFAGLTAEATPSQTMIIRSNKIGSLSKIEVNGGDYLSKWFPNLPLISQGQSAQFELNRQTGNLRILNEIEIGDQISAGVEDAKGFTITTATNSGNYNLSTDSAGRPAEMVIVIDSEYCTQRSIPLLIGGTITISNPSGTIMRIMSGAIDTFAGTLPGDYIYIVSRTAWIDQANTGLFKIISKGTHTTAGVNTYIDVENFGVVPEGPISIADSIDIKAFNTDGYPQIWRGVFVNNPPAEPLTGVVNSLNNDLIGVKASIFKSNSIKITSTTETNGSIAIPVSVGNCSLIFNETNVEQKGNPSHIANRVSDKTLFGLFKRTIPTNTNVWLGRNIFTDQKGVLTSNTVPDTFPFSGAYSEQVTATGQLTPVNVSYDDTLSFTRGNNRGQFRSIKAKIVGDQVGTQQGTARTIFDHIISDEYQLIRPVQISSEDSIVVVMDKDSVNKTIDIMMSRTGRVNSGSNGGTFIPTTTEFSADDYDNEPGIDFSNLTVWSKTVNKTEFADYAAWFRAHNWYATDGVAGTGKMIVRANQFGPNGEKIRFSIKYPSIPNQDAFTFYQNTPSFTNFSYVFGSDAPRPTAISTNDTIAVNGPYPDDSTNFPNGATSSGNYYDYTFSSGNFATVTVGDVLSITDGSGVSTFNRGQFRVAAKTGNTVRVFNPNGSVTSPGAPEVTTITTIADVIGTPSEYTIETVADVGGSLHQTYFIIHDHAGSVAVWYDVNNTGVAPPPHGANRAIKVATVITGDSDVDVANKTAILLALDNAFSVGVISNEITITETQNGPLTTGSAGTSGFTLNYAAGTADITVDGKYFIIHDDEGSCAIWFDVGNDGTPEPFHGADRSIRVDGINYGDDSTTIAAAIVAAVNPDVKFIASNLLNVITITRNFDGNVPASNIGTSGFTISDVDGSLAADELITNESAISIFSLSGTLITDICDTINESDLVTAVPHSGTNISKATAEEDYVYGGNSTALAYGHNPTISTLRDHIKLYDSVNFCKIFANSNPNFTFKDSFLLQTVAPSVYSMDTTPNPGIPDLGELFKLIPVTVKNIHHQLTQKALSQLPIVADVVISNDRKNVQITSKKLGSEGSVEVIGGSANKAQAYLTSESEISTDTSGNYLLVKIPAFPDTFNIGDYIKLQNDAGVKRESRLIATDSIDVTNPSANIIEYNYNPKIISFTAATAITITDVSGTYGRPSGMVWRWTHDGGGGATLAQVREGDLVMAYGTLSGWDQGNKVDIAGDDLITGFPIIHVNDLMGHFDVINPFGVPMTSTVIGSGSTVQICPTPIIKWTLQHAARTNIVAIARSGSTVTVTCSGAHRLNSGDSVDILNSDNIPDGTYSSIVVTSANVFTFTLVGSAFTEVSVGATVIKTGLTPTKYRLEKMGFNNMVRISRQNGESPRFTDCGVAVDDYLVMTGSTFKSNNNGRFRVMAVDNDSIILTNLEATDELNTITPFNDKALQATWTANTNIVTGVAGTFKNLSVGDWIKKSEDPDTSYRQILSFTPGTPASATSITIGNNYPGVSAVAPGVKYDQLNDYDQGVELLSVEDIAIFEGDSAIAGDTLFVQNIINSNWFSVGNIGSFNIAEIGINATTFKPFLRIMNPNGIAENNRLISVNVDGFYIVEGLTAKFSTIKQISHIVLDDINNERRSLYLTPADRHTKFTDANRTSITHMGKFGYSTDVTTGVDGYLYYTGLLRRVQRIVDGYEPDAENFPGRRAVGGAIETLPPLNRRIIVAIDVTTNEGVNLGDISNNIKSVIINYIASLGVGQDVILSEMIAAVMQIKGVAAVTFTTPIPSTERITIANNEKATIIPEDIGIA